MTPDQPTPPDTLLALAAELSRTDSFARAVELALDMTEHSFDSAITVLWRDDGEGETATPFGVSGATEEQLATPSGEELESPENADDGSRPGAAVVAEPRGPLGSEIRVPVAGQYLLSVGSTEANAFDDANTTVASSVGTMLEAALGRIGEDGPVGTDQASTHDGTTSDTEALHRLHELTVSPDEFDTAVDRLLSLGCDHFNLDTGILSHVDGTEYEVEAVVDATGSYEQGVVFDLRETMCAATLGGGTTETLAFADVAETEHTSHPAADNVRAYIAAPVVVNGRVYGTVNFSSTTRRDAPFRPGEREFVKLVAQWIGNEIENRQRLGELERYETIIEAIDDPVYALDGDGRFTFVNEAAKREFGYGKEILGEHVSLGMRDEDIERIAEQLNTLTETDERSKTAQFELETADGEHRLVENRLALIGTGDSGGSAGVLRDVTEREQRRQQLESFQQAIEEAADGVAILDGDEYSYVDQTHVEMYGFDDEDQLLGNTWRLLYDDEEIERLEAEAFPTLDSDGHWRGKVTGRQPDGTTFPAELSLTFVDDGRLVCTVRDETERMARKQELELKERAMDETDVSIQITDPTQNGNPLIYVNDGFEQVTGYTSEEALGRNPRFLQGEETDSAQVAKLRRGIEAEKPVTVEVKNYRADGESYWAKLSVTPVYDDDGNLTNFIGIQQDVSDRRQLLETLEDRTKRLELVLSETGTGIAEWNLQTDAVTWDSTLEETFGRNPETLDEFVELVHPEDRERVQKRLETMIETGEPWGGTFRVGTENDGDRWLETRATAVYEDDEPVRVLATGTDVTERKRKERERLRNERRFQSLFEDPEMLVGLLDTEGTMLEVNETAAAYADATADDVVGEPFWETPWWSHSETLQADLQEWIQRAADGEYVEYSATHPGPDGDTRHITGTIRPVTDPSGSIESLVVSGHDVTDQERQRRELRDRQQKLGLVLSNTDTTIGEMNMQTGEIRWDDTSGDNDIGSPETFESLLDVIHPDDRERLRTNIETMTSSGDQLDGEYRIVTEQGETKWLAAQAVSVEDEQDSTDIVAIATDITELKEREQALEESQQRYQTLLQAAPDPVFVADVETGEIVETNAAGVALRGESRDDIIGRHQSDLHPGDDTEAYRRVFEEAVDGKLLVDELPDGSQVELCTADGGVVPVEINADTVQFEDGPVIYGVFRDVSERVEKERELELKERAMDEANLGITISDPDEPDNPLVYVNDGFVEQTGYSRAEAVGENCRFLQGEDRDQPSLDTLREAIEQEEPVTVELRNYRNDGELFWNRLSVTPIYDEAERLVNYIGIQQDVTAEKTRAQRLRTLHGTTRALLGADNMQDAASVAVETLCESLDVDLAGMYRRDGEEMVKVVSQGPDPASTPERVERGQTPLWEAAESGDVVVYEDVTDIDDGVDRGEVTTSAYFPLDGHGVAVAGTRDPSALDDSTRQLVEVLTANLVAVLDTLERQRELAQEQERFQMLTESLDEYAFITVDEDGTIDTWNEGAQNLFGYDAETAIGLSVAELHPESDGTQGVVDRLLTQARVAGESAHEDWRVRADGSEFYADVRYALLETDEGEFQGYAKVIRDMTERRRQQRRTELFVEESDDVVSILGEDGTFTYTSGSAERVLGYEPGELVGENFFDYIHPNDREQTMERFYEGLDPGVATAQSDCRFESDDGEWLNVEARCRNMSDNEAIDGTLLYLRDVTQSKKRTRRLNAVFNGTFQFTGLLEPDGTVIEVNESALEFGGFERAGVIGEKFYDVPWWTHSGEVNSQVRNALERAADGEFVRYETEVHGATGIATIDFSAKPVTDEDGEVALLIVEGRDITAQRQQRQHTEVLQRVMRHNMRNDLTKVRSWAQIMSEESDDEKRAEQFDRIRRVLEKWGQMTEKLKQIRQAIQSQESLQADTDPESLVHEVVSAGKDSYPATTIEANVSDVGSAQVSPILKQAVQELVENAVTAIEQDDAHVEVALSRQDDDWLEFEVIDNGPGLPEMEVEVLRTGEETQLNHGGGLGLWMVRMLVTQIGGDIAVDATAAGTTVSLEIPTERSQNADGPVMPRQGSNPPREQ